MNCRRIKLLVRGPFLSATQMRVWWRFARSSSCWIGVGSCNPAQINTPQFVVAHGAYST